MHSLNAFFKLIFILREKCSSHPSLKKLLLPAHRNHYRKPWLVKMQRITNCGMPSPSHSTTTIPMDQGPLWKRLWRDFKTPNGWNMRWYLLSIAESSQHDLSAIWFSKQDLNNTITSILIWWGRSHKVLSLDEELQAIKIAERGRISHPQ